VQHKLGDNI